MRALLIAALVACGGSAAPKHVDVELNEATPDQLATARTVVLDALAGQPDDASLIAKTAYIDGVSALLYGTVPQGQAFVRVDAGAPGHREWALGKVAYELTKVSKPEELAPLDQLLAGTPNDPWRKWLQARVALSRGDRVAASALLRDVAIAPAKIDYALLLADEGNSEQATTILQSVADNPLAQNLRALLAVEQGDVAAMQLVVRAKGDAPRIVAYRMLAEAFAALVIATKLDPQRAAQILAQLGRTRALPNECAFWERVAWLHLQLGRNIDKTNDHRIAGIARLRCAALGKATGDNLRLALVDANLQLGIGRPDVAKRLAARVPSLWGKITLAYAELELGNPAPVVALLANPETQAKANSVELGVATAVQLDAQARVATDAELRRAIFNALDRQAKESQDLRVKQALGDAYFATGDLLSAQQELRGVVEATSATRVDPFAYRTRQLLAEVAIANGELTIAGAEIDKALEIHPGNTHSRVLQAKIQLRAGSPDRALEALAPLRKAGELAPAAKLLVAEALVTLKAPTADQRAQAKDLIIQVLGKLDPAEVGRVAMLVDPKLPAELKVPIGKLPKQKT